MAECLDFLPLIKGERARGLAASDQSMDWLIAEVERQRAENERQRAEVKRLRKIEDAARINAMCLSYGAKKPNMTQVLRDNPRPDEEG